MNECPICKKNNNIYKYEQPNKYFECYYCGNFIITPTFEQILAKDNYNRIRMSSWIREQNSAGIIPTILLENFSQLKDIRDKKINQKYEFLLKYMYSKKRIQIELSNLNRLYLVLFWCEDLDEFNILLSKAVELNHLKLVSNGMNYQEYSISYDGKEFVENLGLDNNSNKIFMAFHFTEKMKKEFELTIQRAVNDASEGKLEAVRVSSSTTDHDAKIDDELIGMIKSSKAVIADFTGNRTAVYYEAGFAMGLGIPVIWTCKKDDVDNLSFDTRQYPHIIWENEEDLYTQVVNRLKAKIL
ncbi:hypothetical protein ACN4FT_05655 [Aliarcobacter butzleri]|uniref:hypothetical protein n=1 Tax=Aliarcobacter butzleri TaxID=28197 RepID=UPI003AF76EF7